MPVTISVKNVPDFVAERLRGRAARRHRSLHGELMAILEGTARAKAPMTGDEVLAEVRRLGFSIPAESVDILRAGRNAR